MLAKNLGEILIVDNLITCMIWGQGELGRAGYNIGQFKVSKQLVSQLFSCPNVVRIFYFRRALQTVVYAWNQSFRYRGPYSCSYYGRYFTVLIPKGYELDNHALI